MGKDNDPNESVNEANTKIWCLVGICTLLTIISSVILFFITTKVNNSMGPFVEKLNAQESKLSSHIKDSEKCLNGFSGKIFETTIESVEKSIKAVQKTQDRLDDVQIKLDDKLDEITKLILENLH